MSTDINYRSILESTIGIPFSEYNSIEVLQNGNEIFPAMLEAIKAAEHQIDLLTFVYWSGEIAVRFAKELAQKAKDGLQVRVLLDCYGAAYMPDKLAQMMEDDGVEIQWFRPLVRWKVWKSDNRTHRKVLVCDGKVAFTGGVGIAEEWAGDARNENEYRDTHFKVTGQAVSGLQAAFLENWTEATGILPLQKNWPADNGRDENNKLPIQVIHTSASVRWSNIVMLYQTLIQMAQESIYLSTAYFNPNKTMVKLMKEAEARGVEIYILMPGKHSDMRIARVAGEEDFEALLEGGIELYYYQKTMFHCKVITVDDKVSCIGSANFDHRSMLKDDEVNMVIIDENLATGLNEQFREDLKDSTKISESEWHRRNSARRIPEQLTRLFDNQI
jgi:cardiolipin synthase